MLVKGLLAMDAMARRRRFHVNPFDFSSSRVLDSCLDFLLYSSSDYMLLVISSFPRRSFPSRPTAIASDQPSTERSTPSSSSSRPVPFQSISAQFLLHPSIQPASPHQLHVIISRTYKYHPLSTITEPHPRRAVMMWSSFAWHGMLGSS